MASKHAIRNVVSAVVNTPWLIEEAKLGEIVAFLERRAEGDLLSREDIQQRTSPLGEQFAEPRVVNGVAVLPLHGVLGPRMNLMMEYSGGTSTQEFSNWFQEALDNPKVRGIVLDVDSPGGTATGNEELAQLIRGARGKKPIKAVATSMMASAAYYVASAADEVIVSPSAEVGSVGTYMIHGETSRADEKAGRTFTVIKAGENKAVGNSVEPLGTQGRAVLQERVDAVNKQFTATVAKNRGVTAEAVNTRFGQGKLFLGEQAVSQGLADRVGTLAEVVSQMAGSGASGGKRSGPLNQQEGAVNANIKAALIKAGLVTAEATDELAQVALNAVLKLKGVRDDAGEEKILAAIAGQDAPPVAQTQTQATPPATTVTPPATRDEKLIRAEERARVEDLTARAELLGIDAATLKAAIDSDLKLTDVLVDWTKKMSDSQTPVISHVASEVDTFAKAAEEALSHRMRLRSVEGKPMSSAAESLEGVTLFDLAERSLQVGGKRLQTRDRDTIIEAALRGPANVTILKGNKILTAGAEGGGYNRPGDFPTILSNIAGKVMAQAYEFAPTTYRNWAYNIGTVPDFNPRTIIGLGEFPEFNVVPDGDDFPGVQSPSEEKAFIQLDKYGQEWSLTPVMVANDNLGALETAAQDNVIASEMKLNRLCVNLLVGNVPAQDGVALFHSGSHGNVVGSPAPPDTAQLAAMRLLLRSQRGLSNQRALNLTLYGLLVPEDLETDCEKLLGSGIVVVPTAETGAQLFRQGGKSGVLFWVEPMIGEASEKYYYGFANPRIARPIIFCHQSGYETVRQRTYFNDKNQCRIFQFESRYAAAVRDYRGVVQNPDT